MKGLISFSPVYLCFQCSLKITTDSAMYQHANRRLVLELKQIVWVFLFLFIRYVFSR